MLTYQRNERINEKLPTFEELLQMANNDDNPVEVLKLAMKRDKRVTTVLGHAMNPNFKFLLPPGTPPYRVGEFPTGLADFDLLQVGDTMKAFCNPEAKRVKLEELFIRWLEGMTEGEAKILVHIKDKTLHTMYRKLTEDVFVEALGWDKELYNKLKAEKLGK